MLVQLMESKIESLEQDLANTKSETLSGLILTAIDQSIECIDKLLEMECTLPEVKRFLDVVQKLERSKYDQHYKEIENRIASNNEYAQSERHNPNQQPFLESAISIEIMVTSLKEGFDKGNVSRLEHTINDQYIQLIRTLQDETRKSEDRNYGRHAAITTFNLAMGISPIGAIPSTINSISSIYSLKSEQIKTADMCIEKLESFNEATSIWLNTAEQWLKNVALLKKR
ncbi:hypothetical protein VIBNISOn1_360005 [Vibrio nigripulchritudo SOn1]|uniref:Uncharacterized protein n=2 Tax=Vibrio nigripulchritudo TaxID=28173 RepID=A0AAV2VSV6_9VIBR|nr:hypothetical protein VIBNISOn1_360005 [Vibrio nigripulchritudo SOn1]